MSEKAKILLDRTFNFGINTLKFLRKIPDGYVDRVPKVQLARSSTSIGANYEEAQGALSKKDFSHKIAICYKEARESFYWLRVVKELYPEATNVDDFIKLLNEANELLKIFGAIKKSSIENQKK